MPVPLLHLPLRNSLAGRDRAGIVSATGFGPVRFDAAFGYLAEEATTNICINPDAAIDNVGWFKTGNGPNATRRVVGSDTYIGADRGVDGSGVGIATALNVVAGQTLTVSNVNARVLVGNPFVVNVRIRFYDGPFVNESTQPTGTVLSTASTADVMLSTSSDTTLPTAISTAPVGTLSADVTIVSTAAVGLLAGERLAVRNVMIEKGAYATSFARGDMGAGYSWAGTAHASQSARAASYLTAAVTNHFNSSKGSIVFRINRRWATAATRTILRVGSYGTNDAIDLSLNSSSQRNYRVNDSGVVSTLPLIATSASTQMFWFHMWNLTNVYGNANFVDATIQSAARSGTPNGNVNGPTNGIGIGTYSGSGGAQNANAYIQDLMIFDRPLTNAELKALASAPQWRWDVLTDGSQPGLLLPV